MTFTATSSFQGLLTDFKFSDLVQFIANSRQSGKLDVVASRLTGRVYFKEGNPIHASIKGLEVLEGEDSFLRLVRLEEGSFQFEVGDTLLTSQNIHKSLTNLLLEGMKKYDEWLTFRDSSELELDLIPRLVRKLTVGQATIQLTDNQWEVISHINGRRTFRRIAEKLQQPPEGLMTVFRDIISLGILERKVLINMNKIIPARCQPKTLDYHHSLPSSLKANLLLKFIDGRTSIEHLAEKINLPIKDVAKELESLLESHWIQLASGEKEFFQLIEEI